MKIKVEANELNKVIGKLEKILNKKSNMEILGCIKLSATRDTVSLTANNLDSALVYEVYNCIIDKPGEILIHFDNFKLFSKFKNAFVHIDSSGNHVTVKCNNRMFEFKTLDPNIFPVFNQTYSKEAFTIKSAQLKEMFKIKKMCSSDITKPIFQCICINGNNAWACNTYHGVEYSLPIENKSEDEFLISQKSITELEKIIDTKFDELLTVKYEEIKKIKYISVECENWKYMCKLVGGTYMDLSKVFPKTFATRITVNSGELLESLDFVQEIMKGVDKPFVHLISSNKTLTLEARTVKNFSSDKLSADTYGSTIDLYFNPNYMVDGVKMVGGDNITLDFQGALVVFGNDQERHLISAIHMAEKE